MRERARIGRHPSQAAVLRAGADRTVVADTLRQPLEPDQIALLNELLQHSETYNTLAIRLNGGFGELLDFYGGQRDLRDKNPPCPAQLQLCG